MSEQQTTPSKLVEEHPWYEAQLTNYELQFMSIFADIQVEVGKNATKEKRWIKVPIFYGAVDRVVAAIQADQTKNKPIRLPAMSSVMSEISLAPDLYKGTATERKTTYMPTGGVYPDDIKTIEQRMPIPYLAEFELAIYSSNQHQHHQILEQILVLFDPTLQIQTTDDVFDWKRVSSVKLTSINNEENYPAGADRRIIQSSLHFEVPIYLSVPSVIHNRYVQKIYQRIGMVSSTQETNEQIIAELDSQDIPYELVFNADSIEIR